MNKNRPVKPARDRRLYVICPTLDMMLASCDNVKQLAYDSGLDYSNFVKTCKFQRDIRLSTYQRCAEAFGMDTLILHLPLGAVESFAAVQTHHGNQCLMVQKEDLLRILRHFHPREIDDTISNIERLIEIFLKETEHDLLKKLLPLLAETFQTLAESYGDAGLTHYNSISKISSGVIRASFFLSRSVDVALSLSLSR